jgi:hypothetical protein
MVILNFLLLPGVEDFKIKKSYSLLSTYSSVASFLLPSSLLIPDVELTYTSPENQALPFQSRV